MKTLYVLLVAINNYPKSVSSLRGCINDAELILSYLKNYSIKEEYELKLKFLKDEAATRQGVIEGFQWFDSAKDGDVCFFHYSGHGSQAPAPPEFWGDEPDKKNESIVCWDSREKGGMDLMDKELSYLVWKATTGKKVHFLATMDCCHSGSGFRDDYTEVRWTKPGNAEKAAKEYLGFETYSSTKMGNRTFYSPPRGTYIQLAACKANELAKEGSFNYKTQGIFTYNLVKLLNEANEPLSYTTLIQQIRTRIAIRYYNQSPQLDTTSPSQKNAPFLGGSIRPYPDYYTVAYQNINKAEKAWVVNAGAIQGIVPTGVGEGTYLTLEKDGKEVTIKEVFPNYSIVENLFGYYSRDSYKAKVRQLATTKLNIAFAPDASAIGKAVLMEAYQKQSSALIILDAPLEEARHWLWATADSYWLTPAGQKDKLLFPKVKGWNETAADDLLAKLKKVARWIQILELSNPQTTLSLDSVRIELYQTHIAPNQPDDNLPAERLNLSTPAVFYYKGDLVPAFRLKIKNTSLETLWVSALYMDDVYAINNALLDKQELQPMEEVWMTHIKGRRRPIAHKTIELSLPKGKTAAQDYIKIFVSTDEINTDEFNQGPIDMGVTRLVTNAIVVEKPDWMTWEIGVGIGR